MNHFEFHKVKVIRVIDADTLEVQIDFGFGCFHTTKMRVRGINAPEMRTTEGKLAKQYATGLLESWGNEISIDTYKTDKYGRYVASVYNKDRSDNFAVNLLMNGYARSFMADA